MLLVEPPGGEVSDLQLRPRLLKGEDVVDAAVEKGAVVRDQDEAGLGAQIAADHFSAVAVEVVGGLVDQRKVVLLQKERRQKELGPLPVAQGAKGTIEHIGRERKQVDFPQELPVFAVRAGLSCDLAGAKISVLRLMGEIHEMSGGVDASAPDQRFAQQLEQRGLAAPVAAHQTQAPACVERQGQVFEDRGVRPLVGKGEIGQLNQSHRHLPNQKERAAGKSNSLRPAQNKAPHALCP